MHQSKQGSRRAVNLRKGNHRRKKILAKICLGVIGNTCNTPSCDEEELLVNSSV